MVDGSWCGTQKLCSYFWMPKVRYENVKGDQLYFYPFRILPFYLGGTKPFCLRSRARITIAFKDFTRSALSSFFLISYPMIKLPARVVQLYDHKTAAGYFPGDSTGYSISIDDDCCVSGLCSWSDMHMVRIELFSHCSKKTWVWTWVWMILTSDSCKMRYLSDIFSSSRRMKLTMKLPILAKNSLWYSRSLWVLSWVWHHGIGQESKLTVKPTILYISIYLPTCFCSLQ